MLDRVTITGADDSVDPSHLFELAAEFPFVEWGLLFSLRREERKPRWPTLSWLDCLFDLARGRSDTPRFSLHLCGPALIRFLEGSPTLFSGARESVPGGLLQLCRRVQLNTHGEPTGWSQTSMAAMWRERLPMTEVICQIDGGVGSSILRDLEDNSVDAFPFHDLSHGAGVLPESWPSVADRAYVGFGGGLGPDNLEKQIRLIAEAASGATHWIDMETRVRTRVGLEQDYLDLKKVLRCLEIARPYIGAAEPSAPLRDVAAQNSGVEA